MTAPRILHRRIALVVSAGIGLALTASLAPAQPTADAALPFGVTPTPLEAVAPVYLGGFYPRSRYSRFRYHAGRKTREV